MEQSSTRKRGRGRPLKGAAPATSTERAKQTRRRQRAKARAYEAFANVVRLEVGAVRVNGNHPLTPKQADAIANRALANLKWLDDRLSDLDAAADFFRIPE